MRISDWSSDVCSSDLGSLAISASASVEYPKPEASGNWKIDAGISTAAVTLSMKETGASGLAAAPPPSAGGGKITTQRSEERRVGKECVGTGRSRWSRYH